MRAGRAVRGLAFVAAAVVSATACGSALDEQTLAEANGIFGAETAAGARAPSAAGGGTSTTLGSGSGQAGSQGSAAGPGGGTDTAVVPGAGGETVAAGGAQAPSGEDIVLGSFGTFTGLVGAQVAAMPVAVRAWAADLNARGGINGRPVRVVYGDDGGDPGQTLAVVRRMVEEDHVVAFVGASAPLTMQAATPYLEQVQVPVVGTSGGSLADDSAMVFHTLLAADIGAGRSSLVALVTQSDARRVALVYCREAASCANQASRAREYAATVGVEIVYETQVSIAAPDYTVEMIQARNRGAEAVAAIMDYSSIVRMLRAAHRQGWNPIFASTASVNEEAFVKAAGGDGEGVLAVSNGSVPYSSSPLMQPYLDTVATYVPGGAVGGTGAGAWNSAKLLELVLLGIDGDITSESILSGLYGLQRETLGGVTPPLTFPRGSHERVNLCSVPIRLEGGQFVATQGAGFFCSDDDGIHRR